MASLGLRCGMLQVLTIMEQGAGLVGVVDAGDAQDRERQLSVVLSGRIVTVPIGVLPGMLDPLLKYRRWVAEKGVQLFERQSRLEPLLEFRPPKGLIVPENLVL